MVNCDTDGPSDNGKVMDYVIASASVKSSICTEKDYPCNAAGGTSQEFSRSVGISQGIRHWVGSVVHAGLLDDEGF